ncbi:MAG: hypothetical protein K2G89_03415 [Lachnospiraceae bacterium]|nr:hypothetical protein [Lachnospiraceae bacterium]
MENVLNDWVDSVAIKDYMDALVEFKKQESKLSQFGVHIELAGINEHVHVFRGIQDMVAAVGAKIKEEFREKQIKYHYQYSFIYKGVTFLQLSEERMEEYDRSD